MNLDLENGGLATVCKPGNYAPATASRTLCEIVAAVLYLVKVSGLLRV